MLWNIEGLLVDVEYWRASWLAWNIEGPHLVWNIRGLPGWYEILSDLLNCCYGILMNLLFIWNIEGPPGLYGILRGLQLVGMDFWGTSWLVWNIERPGCCGVLKGPLVGMEYWVAPGRYRILTNHLFGMEYSRASCLGWGNEGPPGCQGVLRDLLVVM